MLKAKTKLVEHHVKYKEIHGVDETVFLTPSEHKRLHLKLRKTGKCDIPSNELHAISKRAHLRTVKSKKYQNDYQNAYRNKHLSRFEFSDNLGCGMRHRENITYNTKTHVVSVTCRFEGHPIK